MVDTFGNNIIGAYTGGVSVVAIYSFGERVWPEYPTPTQYEIYYTTKNGNPLTFDVQPATGPGRVNLVSNTYDSTKGVYVLTFSNPLSQIATSGFQYKSQLDSVILPSVITTINPYAFEGSGLKTISMPGVSVISLRAFKDCYQMRHVTIPSTCTKMALAVFKDSYNLSDVYVEATTPPEMSQEDGGGYTQFSGTSQALRIYVPAASLNDYLSAAGWSSYSDKIVSL